MTMFVAFGHRKRVGKNCAGRFLASYLRLNRKGANIQAHGFADKGKNVCWQLYEWAGLQEGQYYEDPAHEAEREVILPKLGKSPRQIWIDFMTKVAREVHPGTWVDFIFENVKCDVCIIQDLRFPNEADKVHQYGGLVFRIDRAAAPNNSDIADDPLSAYTGWDGIIENNGTMKEFHDAIEAIGARVLEKINNQATS